jgi:hypothetical protein
MNGRIRDEEASTEKSLSHIPVPKDSLQQEILKSAFVTPHARMKFWRDEVSNWLGVCALILLLAGYVAGPIVARKFFRPPMMTAGILPIPVTVWLATYIGTLALCFVLVFFIVKSDEIFAGLARSQLTPRVTSILNASPPALYVFGLVLWTYRMQRGAHAKGLFTFFLTASTIGTCVFAGAFFFTLIFVRRFQSFFRQQKNLAHPEVSLFECLVGFLPLYEWIFRDVGYTRRLLDNLERMAALLEGPLARKFQHGDPLTDSWIQQEMKERAAAIREMKKLVIYSKGNLPEELVQRATNMFVRVCNLDWQSLDRVTTKALTRLERAKQFKQRALRVVGASAVSIALLLLVVFVKPIRELDNSHLLFAGAILFLAINVLSALDPEIAKTGLDVLGRITGGKLKSSE